MLNMLLAAFDNLNPMNWEVLKPALNFLWQGLLAIFVVIGLIIITVKIKAAVIAKCDEAKKAKEAKRAEQETPDNS